MCSIVRMASSADGWSFDVLVYDSEHVFDKVLAHRAGDYKFARANGSISKVPFNYVYGELT